MEESLKRRLDISKSNNSKDINAIEKDDIER